MKNKWWPRKKQSFILIGSPWGLWSFFHVNFKDLKFMWDLLSNSHNYFPILIPSIDQSPDLLLPQLEMQKNYVDNLF